MTKNKLELLLEEQDYVLIDGAMGTMLMEAGLEQGDPPEEWNVLYPERVQNVHRGYVEAGSQIVLTNSFGGTRFRLKLHNFQDRVAEFNIAAAQNGRAVADNADKPVIVAGSIGPSGEIMFPLGELQYDDAVAGFAEQAAALTEGGADVLWIETMSDLNEIKAAIEGARSVSELPIVATMTFDTNGHTMMGVSPEQALRELRATGSLIVGGNCGNGPAEIEEVIHKMHREDPNIVLVAKSNAGIPLLIKGELSYDGTPEVMADYAVRVRGLGARIIGACCGSSPAHIRAMADALANTDPDTVASFAPKQTSTPTPKPRTREHRRSRRRR
jgi:5-methyltetrahydrofolate--homocysteine methyltransferase